MSDPDLGKKRIAAAQKESDKFHEMMGYCIAVWADVDDTLFRIFQHCVGAPLQCAIIYYKTPGLEARFSLTDEIVRSVLPRKKPGEHDHAYVKRWDKAIKKRGDLLAMRRRIAHHPVAVRMNVRIAGMFGTMPYNRMPIGGAVDQFSWLELYMSESEKVRGRDAHLPALLLKDLEDHFDAVATLANDLLGFLIEVLSKPSAELILPNTKHR